MSLSTYKETANVHETPAQELCVLEFAGLGERLSPFWGHIEGTIPVQIRGRGLSVRNVGI